MIDGSRLVVAAVGSVGFVAVWTAISKEWNWSVVKGFLMSLAGMSQDPDMTLLHRSYSTKSRDYLCKLLEKEQIRYEAKRTFDRPSYYFIYVSRSDSPRANQLVRENLAQLIESGKPRYLTVLIIFLIVLAAAVLLTFLTEKGITPF